MEPGVHLDRKRLSHQRGKRSKPNSDNTHASARTAHVLLSLLALVAALYPAQAGAQSISVIQRATLNKQPSSGGTVTLTLPKATGAGHALIVGVSFWPLDLKSVTDSSGDSFTRGITTSIYHNVSQGVMYTNFYYAKNTAGGAATITLNFSGGSTYMVAAVSEVSGLDPSAPLDSSAYHESLSSTTVRGLRRRSRPLPLTNIFSPGRPMSGPILPAPIPLRDGRKPRIRREPRCACWIARFRQRGAIRSR